MSELIKAKIQTALPKIAFKMVRETFLIENAKDLTDVALYLKAEGYDYLCSITGADYLSYLEAVYHFYSMEKKIGPVVLRVRVPRDLPHIPSLVWIYRGAEFQEREIYDMFGIQFENHPDLRRIFMWDGFEGFPLRKDYIQEDSETLETEDIEWLEKHNVNVPEEMKKHAEDLKQQGKRATAERPKGEF
jgi:NADH/F420H2 dehydrogenase subunit C